MLTVSCIHHFKSKVYPMFEGNLIRTAYLLADEVSADGTNYAIIEQMESLKHLTEAQKRELVISYCERMNDPPYLEQVKRGYKLMSEQKKRIKHTNQALIVAYKKLQKQQEVLLKNSIDAIRNEAQGDGFLHLDELAATGELLMERSHPEQPEYSDDKLMAFSELLDGYWLGEYQLYGFCDPFGDMGEAEGIRIHEIDEAGKKTDVLLFGLLKLPILNAYTNTELKSIKSEVAGVMEPVRRALTEWHGIVKTQNFDSKNFSAYDEFFSSKIEPGIDEAEAIWSKNLLLNRTRELAGEELGFDVYVGLCAAKTAWRFMEWSGIMPKESMVAFENNMPEGCDGEKTVLFLLSEGYGDAKIPEPGQNQALG